MERIKDQSWCCGEEVAVRELHLWILPRRPQRNGFKRPKVPVQSIITSCPFCEQNLGDAVSKMDDGLEVQDLTDLLIKVLDIE